MAGGTGHAATIEEEIAALEKIMERIWMSAYMAANPLVDEWNLPWPKAAAWARSRAGWLIKELDGVSADALRVVLRDGLAELFINPDLTLGDLRARILEQFSTMSGSRLDTIIRTETAWASGAGASSAWRSVGVQYVEISDGQDFDTPCIEADGKIVPIEWYEANIIEHPNCTRAAIPLMSSEVDPADVFEPY